MATISTPEDIQMFHLLQMKYALKLEIQGLKHSKGSVYAYVKRTFGFKGNKQKVFDQLCKMVEEKTEELKGNPQKPLRQMISKSLKEL